MWVIVKKGPKAKQIAKWFVDSGAKQVEWPSNTFKNGVEEYAKKGWLHLFHEPRIVLPPQFVVAAAQEHMKKSISPNSQLIFDATVGRVNRVIKSDADYYTLFNDLLKLQPRINLSQAFQIGELCHNDGRPNFKVLVTIEPCEKTLLTELATKVITIGKGVDCDINIEKAEKDKLEEFLESEIINFI